MLSQIYHTVLFPARGPVFQQVLSAQLPILSQVVFLVLTQVQYPVAVFSLESSSLASAIPSLSNAPSKSALPSTVPTTINTRTTNTALHPILFQVFRPSADPSLLYS